MKVQHEIQGLIVADTESDNFADVATKLHCISLCGYDLDDPMESYYGLGIEQGLDRLAEAPIVSGHNWIKHDIMLIKRLYPRWEHKLVIDSMLVSQILYPDRPGGHSIENLAKLVGTEVKVQHEDWSEFSLDMLKRCESDTRLNRKILWRLLKDCYFPITGVDIYHFDFEEFEHNV
jgi:hypothetical protein